MCLINFQYKDHPRYKLVIAANRDEFYERPTAPAQFWEDEPGILAGRDLMQMGTWLGVARNGRIAALTNFRDPSMPEADKISRGAIVRDFLSTALAPEQFLKSLNPEDYTGFNIIAGDADHLFYYNNIENHLAEVEPGLHGLSNHLLDTPWPKVIKGKNYLERYLSERDEVDPDDLFRFLADNEQAPDSTLPKTGVGLEFERMLSSMFIKSPEYGTRSATVVLIDRDNHVTFAERVYEKGEFKEQNVFEFDIE
ncbi:uncharacterized protein with NRDE domain [Planomicrobium sp. HSC-17F08]|nr:uncharacterized protein with NRDE domain [Planomicrobium sp. HSC-17F08]